MLDPTSIDSLIHSLPAAPKPVQRALFLQMHTPGEIPAAAVALTRRGLLGCLPFAHTPHQEIALRLLPGRTLSDCPVVLIWKELARGEGRTLAPDLRRFVAGRVAQLDLADPRRLPPPELREALSAFAAEFGAPPHCRALLETLDSLAALDECIRREELWKLAGPDDALCRALGLGWSRIPDAEKRSRLTALRTELPEVDLLWRLTLALEQNPTEDLGRIACRVIAGDLVFDPPHYMVDSAYWEIDPLVLAARWLQEHPSAREVLPPALWEAVRAYSTRPQRYAGKFHLAYAREIAAQAPVQAYRHAANAAACFARAQGRLPVTALRFAHTLACTQGWPHLETVLGWALQ